VKTKQLEQVESLESRLNRHPQLRDRIDALLRAVEDAGGDLEKADAAERRMIEELRQMGNEALHAWAQRKLEKGVAKLDKAAGICREGKKNSTGIRPSEK